MANVDNVDVQKKDGAQVEITGEITADAFESYRKDAVQKIADETEIEGFRKGKAPEDVLVKKVGEMPILEEMAERALGKEYPTILAEHKIDAIGRPDVQITKIAKGEPLGFKITTATMPEVNLGDYKKAAAESMKETEEVTVSDEEVEEVINQVRTQYATQNAAEQSVGDAGAQAAENNEDTDAEATEKSEEKEGEETATSDAPEAKNTSEATQEAPEASMPELTDAFVQSLGDFKDVADFRAKVTENVKADKEQKARQKKRMEILDAIIEDSSIEVPEMLIEEETNKMMHQFESDVSRMGLQFDEYLKHVGKSREEMRKEWRPDAEKNAKVQLILNKIAAEEDIHPNKERVEEETKKILDMYKDASEDRARNYVETILTNEAVFEFLEKQEA